MGEPLKSGKFVMMTRKRLDYMMLTDEQVEEMLARPAPVPKERVMPWMRS